MLATWVVFIVCSFVGSYLGCKIWVCVCARVLGAGTDCGRGLVSGMTESSGNHDVAGSYWRFLFLIRQRRSKQSKYERRRFWIFGNLYFLLNSKWRRWRSDDPEEGKLKAAKLERRSFVHCYIWLVYLNGLFRLHAYKCFRWYEKCHEIVLIVKEVVHVVLWSVCY